MASVASYGGYTSADNEVNLVNYSFGRSYSPRGKKLTETRRIHLEGELNYDTPAALVTAANSVIAGFSTDGGNFRYTVGGTLAHSLTNSGDCVSGVRVVRTSFPKGDPAEICTTRTFWVDLEGTYDATDDDLISWQEQIETIGTGGPIWCVVDTVFGPFQVDLTVSSAQYYTQSGMAVGYRNYPDTPGPVFPPGEFAFRRRVSEVGGRQMGNGLRYFTKKWTYYMVRGVANIGFGDFHPVSK